MTAIALAALALAALAWPAAAAPARLRVLRCLPDGSGSRARWRPPAVLTAVAALALVTVLAGMGGAVAASLVTVVLVRARRVRRREREEAAATGGMSDGLTAFAAELRAGHPPASAAGAAARDAHTACAAALVRVEATARLGGDVPSALRRHAAADGVIASHLDRLADAWSLADRHGIGLAGLAEALAEDLRARSRFSGRLAAQLAGPRTTASALAALPLLGLGMGQLIGADPWGVLTGTTAGQVLLVVGAVFVAAGLEWSGRIVARVVR